MASISQIYNLVSYGTMKKKQPIKKLIIISLLITALFIIITVTQAESSPGCWWDGTDGGNSICPSDYKHANTDPRYKEYEPVPMTIKDAFNKGWREWLPPTGRIERLTIKWGPHAGELKYSDETARKLVGFFCPDSEGKPMLGHGAHNENPTTYYYSRRHLHPRTCPPDQYRYLNVGKWPTLYYYKCSGSDPNKLGRTPYLSTYYKYSKYVRSSETSSCSYGLGICKNNAIDERKMAALCPLPRNEKPVCKPGHRMGYHFVQAPGTRGFHRALDCVWNGTSDDDGDESGGGEEEEKECSQEDYESNEKYKKLPEKCKIGKCGKIKELKPKKWETKNIIPEMKKAISQKLKLKTDNSEKIEIQNITAETKVDNQCGKIKIGEREFNDCVITGVLHIFRYPILIKLAMTIFRKI